MNRFWGFSHKGNHRGWFTGVSPSFPGKFWLKVKRASINLVLNNNPIIFLTIGFKVPSQPHSDREFLNPPFKSKIGYAPSRALSPASQSRPFQFSSLGCPFSDRLLKVTNLWVKFGNPPLNQCQVTKI